MLEDYTMTPNRAGIPVWRPAQPAIGREDEHQTALTNWARMIQTQTHRDMWQNNLVWWMCKAIKLLLEERMRGNE